MLYYPYMVKNEDKLKGLGNKLKKARKLANLTQSAVATAAGVNVNYYARIERGEINPSYENLQIISKALNIKFLDMS